MNKQFETSSSASNGEVQRINFFRLGETEMGNDLKMVQQNGMKLTDVKEQTPELCLAAVQQNGLVLCFVEK